MNRAVSTGIAIVMAACGACGNQPGSGGGNADASRPRTTSANAGAPRTDSGGGDAGVDAAAPLVPATTQDDRTWFAFVDALGEGRRSMRAKSYRNAVGFYNEALALEPRNPRALLERAAAYLEEKRYDDARLDLESARDRAPSEDLAVEIDLELGNVREALGDAEGARAAFADVQNIHPSGKAGQKLIGKSPCDADLDTRKTTGVKAADWLAAWTLLAADYARDHEILDVPPATTVDDAKGVLCPHGCEGAGPWAVTFGADEKELALVVAAQKPNGSLVLFPRIGRARGGPCASEDSVTIDTSQSPAHVFVRSDPLERTFTKENVIHERVECDSTLKECAAECLSRGWSERDWWIDLATATRVLAIERVGRLVGTDRHGRVRVSRAGDDVIVQGGYCDERLPLPKK